MLTQSDWQAAMSDVVHGLQSKSQVIDPPVDALKIARDLGLVVAVDGTQAGRGRLKRIHGRPAMFLRPEPRPERLQWTAAHEIGELHVERVCRAAGVRGEDLLPRQREDLANRFAQELLLPLEWFRRDCAAAAFDLPELKARYRTASHELIAWRFLDLEESGIVTIYDQGVLTRRRGNDPRCPAELFSCEQTCLWRLRNIRQPQVIADAPFTVRGWCIDSPGWHREIIYTRSAVDSEAIGEEFED